jgi:LmbE family N-acetylglucosaminyl deacetylase
MGRDRSPASSPPAAGLGQDDGMSDAPPPAGPDPHPGDPPEVENVDGVELVTGAELARVGGARPVDPATADAAARAATARFGGSRPGLDVLVPDGVPFGAALARTTDLGIGAHPDDLELLMVVPAAVAYDRADRWFTGVTVTDGAGSPRRGRFAALSGDELVAVRRAEQRRAAAVGRYAAAVQLAYPSAGVRDPAGPTRGELVEDLVTLLRATRPVNVYTHNLADAHATHVAVAAAVITAVRALAPDERPTRLVGVEGWRDLDWLPREEQMRLDASGVGALGDELAACFPSQIEGGKRYDRAVRGRRWANATLAEAGAVDEADEVSVAMDLTPLMHNTAIDPVAYVVAAVTRFRDDVETTVRNSFGPPGVG